MRERRICVVTGTRAEYGLLKPLLVALREDPALCPQLVVTGAHLSPEFGLTYREIEQDGFQIDRRVEMLLSSDSPVGTTKSTGLALIGLADAFAELAPNFVVVLGDRFEILAAATAALFARVPVAHLHGGETTEGAFDEAIRHAVTKMSLLHFVAAEPYRNRVVQLGEDPSRVFTVGGLGVDAIRGVKLMSEAELSESLGMKLGNSTLLVTFHPPTLERQAASAHIAELLLVLEEMKDVTIVFTAPNADPESRDVLRQIEAFAARNAPRAKVFTSLGQLRYLSLLSRVDAIVGNSSSGLAEAPTFRVPTINIGDRQKGRLRAASVIDCGPEATDIRRAFEIMRSRAFRSALATAANPYGDGGAAQAIARVLRSYPLNPDSLKKAFHDLPGH